MTAGAWVTAHQGGWDEMLLVATPLGLFALLLRIANARAARQGSADDDRAAGPDGNAR